MHHRTNNSYGNISFCITEPIIPKEIQVFASQNQLLLRKYKVWSPKTNYSLRKNQNKPKENQKNQRKSQKKQKNKDSKMDPHPWDNFWELCFFCFFLFLLRFFWFSFGFFWFSSRNNWFLVIKPCISLGIIGFQYSNLVFP